MTQSSKQEERPTNDSLLNRRQFLALFTAGTSALLFGAACGIGGGEGGEEDED